MLIIDYLDEDVKELIGEYLLKTIKKKKLIEQKHSRKYHVECFNLSFNSKINSLKCIITEAVNRLNIPKKVLIDKEQPE